VADERFAICDEMVIIFVLLLGVGNFALHRAVLASGHPRLGEIGRMGGRATLGLEFAVLLLALFLVHGGRPGWAWAYLGYSALNALAAWLILSRRI
jgi:hypothetical protein